MVLMCAPFLNERVTLQHVFSDGKPLLYFRSGGTDSNTTEIAHDIVHWKLAEAHRLAKCHSVRALMEILASWDEPCQAAISQAANHENAVLFRTVQCMEDLQDAVFGFRHFVFFSFSFTCKDVESQHLLEYISTCGYMLENIMQHLG